MNDDELDEAKKRLKERQEVEQGMAWLFDTLPGNWRRIYTNCIKEGFTELESMEILKTYIISQGSGNKTA